MLPQLRRMHKADPEAAEEVEERDHIFSTPPVFKAPHYPIAILCERDVVLHAIVALLLFGSMFCSITELPLYLAAPPYNLSAAMIGECGWRPCTCSFSSHVTLLDKVIQPTFMQRAAQGLGINSGGCVLSAAMCHLRVAAHPMPACCPPPYVVPFCRPVLHRGCLGQHDCELVWCNHR
jgi:hypothetical protein